MNDTEARTTPTPANPQPATVTPLMESEARTWALMVHLLAVVAQIISGGFLGFVAPLVIWLIHRERSALVDFHGRQNLNLQLTVLVTGLGAGLIGAATIGLGLFVTLPVYFAYAVYAFIISIVAGLKANDGEYFRIRFIMGFIR